MDASELVLWSRSLRAGFLVATVLGLVVVKGKSVIWSVQNVGVLCIGRAHRIGHGHGCVAVLRCPHCALARPCCCRLRLVVRHLYHRACAR